MLKLLLTGILPIFIIYYLCKVSLVAGILATVIFIALFLFLNLSDLFMMRGAMIYGKNPQKALTLMKKGFSFRRPDVKYSVYYSYVCLREGKWEDAEKAFEKIKTLKLAPDDKMRNDLNLSLYFWKQNRIDEAVDILEELLEGGDNAAVYTNLGYFLILKKDYQRALEINLKAHEYDEYDDAITDNLALTYYHLGEYEKSRDLYEELTDHKLKMPVPYYHFGELLYTLGEKEAAVEMMEQALEYPFTHLATVSKKHIRDRIDRILQAD